MATPISFDPASLQVPLVAAAAGGVGTLFTSYAENEATILGVSIPAPVYVAMAVGVASFVVVANSSYLLPWLGVTDPTTYNAIYFATPFVTGIATVAFDAVLSLISGGELANSSDMLTLFTIGAVAGVLGQWSAGMNK